MIRALGKRKVKQKPCPMPGCWEETPNGRMCSACSSWWYRTQDRTPGQLAEYMRKVDRFAGRATRLRGRKGIRGTRRRQG